MLIDLIRGRITLFSAIVIAALIAGRIAWREHSRNQREREAMAAQFAPAQNQLPGRWSATRITEQDTAANTP